LGDVLTPQTPLVTALPATTATATMIEPPLFKLLFKFWSPHFVTCTMTNNNMMPNRK